MLSWMCYQIPILLLLSLMLASETTMLHLSYTSTYIPILSERLFIILSMSPQPKLNYLLSDVELIKIFKSWIILISLLSLILFIWLNTSSIPSSISINSNPLPSWRILKCSSTKTHLIWSNSGIVLVIVNSFFTHQLTKTQRSSLLLQYFLAKCYRTLTRKKDVIIPSNIGRWYFKHLTLREIIFSTS